MLQKLLGYMGGQRQDWLMNLPDNCVWEENMNVGILWYCAATMTTIPHYSLLAQQYRIVELK